MTLERYRQLPLAEKRHWLVGVMEECTPDGQIPEYGRIVRNLQAVGVYSPKTNPHDAMATLRRAWLKRHKYK